MKRFSEISSVLEFERDLKKLQKKFQMIEDDLTIFIEKGLFLYHKLKVDNKGVFPLSGLQIDSPKIYKAKKFACRSLKGRGSQSGIRVIYAYFEEIDKIELIKIYYKGDKENEDRDRILKYYKK